jgi:hypothetical protein
MPFIKLNQPKYLSQGQYLITDADPDSLYFDVSEMPDILTGGKNMFMLKGNQSLLAPGSTIEIEVTDLNGRPIYHENAAYMEPGTKRRVVAIYVYEHTPQGGGVITITGTAKKRPNGNSVPASWADRPNVTWRKKINVLPYEENTTRVIMKRDPNLVIKELQKTYLTPSGGLDTHYQGNFIVTAAKFEPAGDSTGNASVLTTTSSYFTIDDINTTMSIYNGAPVLAANQTLISAPVGYLGSSPRIINVVNQTTAIMSYALPYIVETEHFFRDNDNDLVSYTTTDTIHPIIDTPSFVHVQPSITSWVSQETNVESWAKVYLSELDPICGDIKNVKVFRKSQGSYGWQFVNNIILEDYEILANDDSNGLTQDLGQFYRQTIIDAYWTGSYSGVAIPVGYPPSTMSNSTVFINGVVVSGSEYLKANGSPTREDAYLEYRMKPSADWNNNGTNTSGVELLGGGNYTLSFKLASQAVDDGGAHPSIRVYVSGSAIDTPIDGSSMQKLATFTTTQTTPVTESSTQWDVQTQDPMGNPPNYIDPAFLNYPFDITNSGSMSVVFQIQSGRWHISDVSIRAAKQTGWTPNHTVIEFHAGVTAQQNDVMDFKFELYDNVGNKVHTEHKYNVSWTGSNTAITGTNNTIEGSLIIGNGIIFEGVTVG